VSVREVCACGVRSREIKQECCLLSSLADTTIDSTTRPMLRPRHFHTIFTIPTRFSTHNITFHACLYLSEE